MSRVALISGGTSGIGAAIARALQAAGYRVAVNYAFTTDRAEAFQKETGIPAFQWDVRDYDACVNGIARVEETFGPVEVLVNKAGPCDLRYDGQPMELKEAKPLPSSD